MSYQTHGPRPTPQYDPNLRRQHQMLPPQQRLPQRPSRPDHIGVQPQFAEYLPLQEQPHWPLPPRPQPSHHQPQQQQRQHHYANPGDLQDAKGVMHDGRGYYSPQETGGALAWPLVIPPPDEFTTNSDPRESSQHRPRPNFPPAVTDSPQQIPSKPPPYPPEHSSLLHGPGEWNGDAYAIPTSSQYASQPLPPLPTQQQQQIYGRMNQRPPLGPPPSARRGPASYYPHAGPVLPIVEESESIRASNSTGQRTRGSFASSNAIPVEVPRYYVEGPQREESMPSMISASEYSDFHPENVPEECQLGLSSREETAQNDQAIDLEMSSSRHDFGLGSSAIMRQASLGRRSKPKLTTVQHAGDLHKNGNFHDRDDDDDDEEEEEEEEENDDDDDDEGGNDRAGSLQEAVPTAAFTSEQLSQSDTVASLVKAQLDKQRVELDTTAGSPRHTSGDHQAVLSENGDLDARGPPLHNDHPDFAHIPSSEALRDGSSVLDEPPAESDLELRKSSSKEMLGYNLPNPQAARTRARSPLAPRDPREADIRMGLEKSGALETAAPRDGEFLRLPNPGMSDRPGRKRPPRLDVSAVKEAEARGSLSSLHELIKRNMTLASNLERGRTASRIGLDRIKSPTSDGERQRHSGGSLSNILLSFPAPGLSSSNGSKDDVRPSFASMSKSSNLKHAALPSDSDASGSARRPRRRCCGMSVPIFILLMVVLLLLVTAAVVVPVMLLVVVPNQRNDSTSSCHSRLSCQNGGIAVSGSDGRCRCICVNGYTGGTCSVVKDAACTTISVGSSSNATVGSAIPRLLESADSEFGVPLDAQTVLGLFSSSGLSCSSENALVTFNAVAERSLQGAIPVVVFNNLVKRQTATTTATQDSAATSNSIVFDSAPSSSTATGSSSSSTPTPSLSNTTVDFARVAVLFVFQESGTLDIATTAQSNLQSYFHNGDAASGQTIDPSILNLGNAYSCDLTKHTLILANGTTIGKETGSSNVDSSASSAALLLR